MVVYGTYQVLGSLSLSVEECDIRARKFCFIRSGNYCLAAIIILVVWPWVSEIDFRNLGQLSDAKARSLFSTADSQ